MNSNVSMTEGRIWSQIIRFTIPLILGNIFQQLYSTFDSIIVGNYIGSKALAAIGACDPAISIMLGLCVGLSAGTGVLVSHYYGAKDYQTLTCAIQCIVVLGVAAGVILTALGLCFVPFYIRIVNFPSEVKNYANIYLIIYLGGMFFRVIYNMLSGIMNAVGNSKRTLIYLSITSVLNIILDLFFVVGFHWGIAGAAVATVLSEAISMFLVFCYLYRTRDVYRIILKNVRLNKYLCKELIRKSIPTGLQNVVRAFANMIVQISINSFGTAAIAGYAIYIKVDSLNWLPSMSMGITAATFAGQNFGAKQYGRIRKGIKAQVLISIIYTTITGIFLLAFSEEIIGIFTNDVEAISYGVEALWWFTPFYAFYAIMMIFTGTLAGVGNTFQSMLVNFYSLCVFRIIGTVIVNMMLPTFSGIMALYPLSWIVGVVLGGIWLKKIAGNEGKDEGTIEK